jgi:hypothetical protein
MKVIWLFLSRPIRGILITEGKADGALALHFLVMFADFSADILILSDIQNYVKKKF